MPAAVDKRVARIAHIRAALRHVSAVAEPLPQARRGKAFVADGVAKRRGGETMGWRNDGVAEIT